MQEMRSWQGVSRWRFPQRVSGIQPNPTCEQMWPLTTGVSAIWIFLLFFFTLGHSLLIRYLRKHRSVVFFFWGLAFKEKPKNFKVPSLIPAMEKRWGCPQNPIVPLWYKKSRILCVNIQDFFFIGFIYKIFIGFFASLNLFFLDFFPSRVPGNVDNKILKRFCRFGFFGRFFFSANEISARPPEFFRNGSPVFLRSWDGLTSV